MPILLSDLLPLGSPDRYKVHLACFNQEVEPLDVFVRSRSEWDSWNTWRANKDDFNRERIFSLINFFPEPDTWLFGGSYNVLSRRPDNSAHSYCITPVDEHAHLTGRLKVRFRRPGRAKAVQLERYLKDMEVIELLREPYSGARFPGYEDVSLMFSELQPLLLTAKPDWKAALEHVKGVYLIADITNGRKYVGSACGATGIWSRWLSYVINGHGDNDELVRIVKEQGLSYALANFRMTLLEYRPAKTDDQIILDRECFWKKALLSRGSSGYNKN